MLFAPLMLPDEPLQLPKLRAHLPRLVVWQLFASIFSASTDSLLSGAGLGIILRAASAAFSNVLLKAPAIQLASAMIAGWQMIFGAAPLLLIGLVVERNPLKFHWNVVSVSCLLYLAIIGSALTFLLLYWLLPRMTVARLQAISHHATWRRRVRLGSWRRDIFPVVASWRVPCALRRADDFPKGR